MELQRVLLPPSKESINEYVVKFDRKNAITEKTINKIINIYPKNILIEDILTKVVIINRLYSTNIYDIYEMSFGIKRLDIDEYLNKTDLGIVEKIANSYIKAGKHIYCYSFATKYCSFHNNGYPLYDSIIDKMLCLYNEKDNFSNFRKYDLKNYLTFVRVLNDFITYYTLGDISYKDLDKYLWQYGKDYLYGS
ncbi:hypothetical protein [Desulfovibrio sp. ZJ369]|uniref:hypothetical protein n=1 Tax=Desulfovibrio sp. ZJ369 TaxID=2709793 RepID=UPI0013EE22FE|nr:hypothetical protein [Desulfovibrio sp. ZJ369]